MRIPVNLAHEPFRRDRSVFVASAGAAVVLVISLGILITQAIGSWKDARHTQALLDRVNRQISVVSTQQAKVDAQMRLPGNEVVLDRSILLNDLIKLKATSWTKIFSDLEKVLPNNVRILSIRPSINSRDEVFLDMQVAADAPEQVISFMQKLEGSDVFGAATVSNIISPTQTDPFYRYRLSVSYAQKL